ncbi:hypothetical protein D9M68_623260 [compost metagenome]
MFGRDDVGAVDQQRRRQAGRQVAHDGVVVQPRRQLGQIQRRAKQQFQRMGLRRAGLFQVRAQGLGLLPQRFDLGEIQLRDGADFVAAAENAQRRFARGDGLAGQRQAFVQFAQRQVAVRHLRDQAQRGRAGGGVGGQVVLQRGVLQVAHAAPEVQLPAGHAEPHLVLARDLRLPGEVQVARHAGAGSLGLHADGGELVRALDAVQRARFLDAQQRVAQVAVVVEGGGDEALQHRIREIGLPRDIGRGRGRRGAGIVGRIRGGHGQGGAVVVGRQRNAAAGQQHQQGCGGEARGDRGRKRAACHARSLQRGGGRRGPFRSGRLVAPPSGRTRYQGHVRIVPNPACAFLDLDQVSD